MNASYIANIGLCNGLLANVGLGNVMHLDGGLTESEQPLVTAGENVLHARRWSFPRLPTLTWLPDAGDDINEIKKLLHEGEGCDGYTAGKCLSRQQLLSHQGYSPPN
jgi:hypothetical protein